MQASFCFKSPVPVQCRQLAGEEIYPCFHRRAFFVLYEARRYGLRLDIRYPSLEIITATLLPGSPPQGSYVAPTYSRYPIK